MEELQEKDFIHEEYQKDPYPFWFWSFVVLIATFLIWAVMLWYTATMERQVEENPFLQVTNRQFSLFLWQNPQHMRVNAKNKTGYLPGFQYIEKVSMDLQAADDSVIAPPEVIFLYHTWHRLLGQYDFKREISPKEFQEFLNYLEEWQPEYWPGAPKAYRELIESLPNSSLDNLAALPYTVLPLEVRQAFVGWKNFFKEGEEINLIQPTYGMMEGFLEQYPHYKRNYWRNLVMEETPQYLEPLKSKSGNSKESSDEEVGVDSLIPNDHLTAFLRVAFYNFMKSKER